MAELRFEWDSRKESVNLRKHGISFVEAESVFFDEHALLRGDPEHSEDEDRFVLLGMSVRLRILIVVHCYRGQADTIRIISARRATRPEARQYEKRWPS